MEPEQSRQNKKFWIAISIFFCILAIFIILSIIFLSINSKFSQLFAILGLNTIFVGIILLMICYFPFNKSENENSI